MKYCLYHANCMDGFMAYYLVWRHIDNIIGIPINYGEPFPDIPNATEIWIVDFSIDIPEQYRSICKVFDHHKSSKAPGCGASLVVFDESRSGCGLVAKHFDVKHIMCDYIEDRDLWLWKLPNSHKINAALAVLDKKLDVWNIEYNYFEPGKLAYVGGNLIKQRDQYIERIVKNSEVINGVTFINSPILQSELGDSCEGLKVIYSISRGMVNGSCRGPGALEYAQRLGGGGHALAAGFRTSLKEFLDAREG